MNEETKTESTTPGTSAPKNHKRGASARLVILLLFLVVVGAGCIYEFSVARPNFQEAWEKIRQVDEGPSSSETTREEIREMMGREPFNVDDTLHDECVVETYRWPSGMVVKNHDIHVVYTKLKKGIEESQPKLKGKLFYYSASAGQPLDLEDNFPQEKQTIVVNLNPPQISMGGGPPPGQSNSGSDDEGKDDDDSESDKEETDTEEKEEGKSDDDGKEAESKEEHSHEGEQGHGEDEHSHEAEAKSESSETPEKTESDDKTESADKKPESTEKSESTEKKDEKSDDKKADKKEEKSDG